MVLDYLTKQKLDEHRKTWSKLEKVQRRKDKEVRKPVEKPAKKPPPKFLFGIPIEDEVPGKIQDRVDKVPPKPQKPKSSFGSSLFQLSKLFLSKPKAGKRKIKPTETTTATPKWLTPPKDLHNPLLTGDQKPDLDYFGPSDFVPQNRYHLPMQQHGPLKLRYMSAKDFPNVQKYGLIPIPR